jgi:TPR repeat protein
MRRVSKTILSLIIASFFSLFLGGCESVNNKLTQYEAKRSYKNGQFVRAYRLSESLAYKGDSHAQYVLAYMYYHGMGFPPDHELALFWLKQSADRGYEPAIIALTQLEELTSSHS